MVELSIGLLSACFYLLAAGSISCYHLCVGCFYAPLQCCHAYVAVFLELARNFSWAEIWKAVFYLVPTIQTCLSSSILASFDYLLPDLKSELSAPGFPHLASAKYGDIVKPWRLCDLQSQQSMKNTCWGGGLLLRWQPQRSLSHQLFWGFGPALEVYSVCHHLSKSSKNVNMKC